MLKLQLSVNNVHTKQRNRRMACTQDYNKNVMILPKSSCAELFQNLTINPSKSVNEDKGSERKKKTKKQ